MKYFCKYMFLLPLLCLMLALEASAQQEKAVKQSTLYHGVVMDAQNKPLLGVTVFIQEKAGQIETSIDGNFSIKGEPGDVLILKMAGYLTSQQVLGDSRSLQVKLLEAPIDAGEEDNAVIPFA